MGTANRPLTCVDAPTVVGGVAILMPWRTGTSRPAGPGVPSCRPTHDGPVPARCETLRVAASSELSLRWLTTPAEATPALRSSLTSCWRDVANAGGAVGFAELLPVSDDDVAPVVDELAAGLDPKLNRLLVAARGDALAGWLLLTGNTNPVTAHWGHVSRVQTALRARGTGVATALMTELHRSATDDLRLDSLRLGVRGGMGLESFYARFGWVVVGSWPGALQFTQHGRRDEVLMSVDLRRPGR
jgi:GNAT superfamily N-acetyltransferase